MPDEHRPPATGTPPTPTEACPAAHAARGIAATPPRSRSRRSGFHAQQADPSRQPVAVPRRWDQRPARPSRAAAPPSLHCGSPLPQACRTGKGRRTPASLPHTVALRSRPELRPPRDRHAKEELGRHIPVATASRGRCPGILFSGQPSAPKMRTGLPSPAARCRGTAPTPPTPSRRPRAAARPP
nr:uncharacterized protein LOC127346954 [Lolium perenne]